MTTLDHSGRILQKLDRLRTELTDLAFHLERRGRVDAADLAIALCGRLAELAEEAQREVSEAGRLVR
jgi:hypothetical protein